MGADRLIRPAGFAGNSGENSGFRQKSPVRRSFFRQNHSKFKVLTESRRCRRNSGEIRRNSGFRARGAEIPSHEESCGPCILRPRKRIAQSGRITPVETWEWGSNRSDSEALGISRPLRNGRSDERPTRVTPTRVTHAELPFKASVLAPQLAACSASHGLRAASASSAIRSAKRPPQHEMSGATSTSPSSRR